MTFPTFQSVTTGSSQASVTSRTVSLPATINPGDVLLAIIVVQGTGVIAWDHVTAGGWNFLHDDIEGVASSNRLAAYWKVADGTEDGLNLTIVTSEAVYTAWHIYRYSNASSVECGIANTANGLTQQPNPPPITPSWGAHDNAWLVAIGTYLAMSYSPSSPYGSFPVFTNANQVGLNTGRASPDFNAATHDPGIWSVGGQTFNRRYGVSQTYAIKGQSNVFITPPALTMHWQVPSPIVANLIQPPAISLHFTVPEPNVATLQDVAADPVNLTFTVPAPRVIDGIGPYPVTLRLEVPSPTVVRELHDIDPDPVNLVFRVPKPLVTGGARTVPQFTRIAIGTAPGATGDLAIYDGFAEGAAFQNRWDIRGPIGFGDFTPFVAGEYEFSEAYVWMRFTVEPVERTFAITRARMNVDVPDVQEARQLDIGAAWTFVAFERTFYFPPVVVAQVIIAEDVSNVPRCTVRDDVSTSGFWVVAHDGADPDDAVAATISFIASGY